MNDPASPAALLTATFESIHHTRMADMPLSNDVLEVEAVEFAPWGDHWLGVLVTPWCMNLVLMPRIADRWYAARPGDTVSYTFPAGVFGFIAAHEPRLGDYHACSLFSPMFEFADQETARVAASAARAALLDPGANEPASASDESPQLGAPMTKRDFLRLPQ
jgi:[NiFe] hydrogenase assembly HybE family chaperone